MPADVRIGRADATRFGALWRRCVASPPSPVAADVYADLRARLSEPAREFHNLGHIDDCLTRLDEVTPHLADPDAVEIAYDGVPLRAMLSLMDDGVGSISDRFAELTMPLLLITSRQDHVVDPGNSEHLAATYGGAVEHVWLERSYHVATQDYDAEDINRRAGEFVARVVSG